MLSLVTQDDAVKRLALLAGGSPDSREAVSNFLRAEVHARKHAPRAATLSRVARLLGPAVLVDEERLDEICDALEREGDLVLAPGGVLYATPTRVVVIERRARVFGSLPTRALEAALGREVTVLGVMRTVAATDDLVNVVAKIGGATVTPNVWAGIDRTPKADSAFISKLDQRLEWEPVGAGVLEKDGPLEWRAWEVTGEGARWRRSREGRLWWARTRFGGHHRTWTAGASPATSPFVELSPDDSDRARFALARDVAGASVLRVVRSGASVAIEVPGWLPRPEYRWLSLHGGPAQDGKRPRWEIAAADEVSITELLADRLGLVVEAQ